MSERNEPIAWLRDVGSKDEPCYVPASNVDADIGAFPVYGEPQTRRLFDILSKVDALLVWGMDKAESSLQRKKAMNEAHKLAVTALSEGE